MSHQESGRVVKIDIDGRVVEARTGEFLLAVAKRAGIDIPAICQHEAVDPAGNCRMCLVEITKASWDGWSKLVTACLYPVEKDLIVKTRSASVMEARTVLVDLWLARCPDSAYVRRLAAEYGVEKTSYQPADLPTDQCILCGLCIRVCEKLGPAAIATVNRGGRKKVAGPFEGPPPDCIGCAACAEVCPTDCIKVVETNGTRTIWEKQFELLKCSSCGHSLVTVDEARYFAKKGGLTDKYYQLCDRCKRLETAQQAARVAGLPLR
jgi:NADH dehydrogenase/NADH:ubiquinone oxidoreductase subunit G